MASGMTFARARAALFAVSGLALGSTAALARPPVTPDANARLAWRQALERALPRAEGCFKASYPDAAWTATACVQIAHPPYIPRTGGAGLGAGNVVGNGHDDQAEVTAPISKGVGSFTAVSGVTSETNSGLSNVYSLQENSNFFSGSPTCNGASNPATCQAWQQFVFSNQPGSTAFIQYWLINYAATCPSGWTSYSTDCYRNSASVRVPRQPLSALSTLSVTGTAQAGGIDTMMLTTATNAYALSGKDSVVGLANGWTGAEYNIIGDGGGSQAKFNKGSSFTVKIALTDGLTVAPACVNNAGTTGETNNLNLGACTSASGATPSVSFVESN